MAWTEQLPSGRYRGSYRLPTGRVRRVPGTFPHKRAAMAAATRAEEEAAAPGWRDPKAAGKKWGDWADKWWLERDVSDANLRTELSAMKRIRDEWATVPLADITRSDVRGWAVRLKREGLQPSSVNRYLNVFRASLSAAVDAEILLANPAAGIRLEVGEKDVRRYLTQDEAMALIAKLSRPSDVRFAMFLFGCGPRYGEAAGLQVQRVSRAVDDSRIAEAWVAKTRSLAPYTKSRMIRNVPIPEWTADEVRPLVKGRRTGFVFSTKIEEVPDYSNFYKRWVKAGRAAGLGSVKVHDARHTYASWLLQNGITLAEVGRLLGHVDPTTTQIYAHLAPQVNDHIFAALPTLRRGADRGENLLHVEQNVEE